MIPNDLTQFITVAIPAFIVVHIIIKLFTEILALKLTSKYLADNLFYKNNLAKCLVFGFISDITAVLLSSALIKSTGFITNHSFGFILFCIAIAFVLQMFFYGIFVMRKQSVSIKQKLLGTLILVAITLPYDILIVSCFTG